MKRKLLIPVNALAIVLMAALAMPLSALELEKCESLK